MNIENNELIITHKILTQYINKVRREDDKDNSIYIENLEKFQVVLNKEILSVMRIERETKA